MLSDGSPTRTFCYITDAITGYYKALVNGRPGEAYNIGQDRPEISMRELADRLAAIGRELFELPGLGRQAEHRHPLSHRQSPTPVSRHLEGTARARFFDPQSILDEGFRRSVIWYAANAEGEDA